MLPSDEPLATFFVFDGMGGSGGRVFGLGL
jgi:hypothetical protein